tara:strand:- start:297 stop:1049 length:753 start_codon:yes stop_codon:yes gene_type:complete
LENTVSLGQKPTHTTAVDSHIAQVLDLQDKDIQRLTAEHELKAIPLDILRLEEEIKKERAVEAAEKKALQDLEVKRKDLDGSLKKTEEQIVKYKTQQLEVKKNEEYQALEKEIEHLNAEVDQFEEQEIELLLKIDEETERLKASEAEHAKHIAQHEKAIAHLKEREASYRENIETLRTAFEEAEALVDVRYKKAYERVKTTVKKPPFVVILSEHKCQGCFLRVSNDVESAVRQPEGPVQCSNCSRLVYID